MFLEGCSGNRTATEDERFLGALAAKLAHRGEPAPSSILVERHVLHEAHVAGVLDFRQSSQTGEIRFSCRSKLQRLEHFLRVCLIPDLLVEDADLDPIFERYRSLCTPCEEDFFEQLLHFLPERRLGLFWLPQRLLGSMADLIGSSALSPSDRVDFALEVPGPIQMPWVKIAVELDDATHTGAQRKQDNERDRCLRAAGWLIFRLRVNQPCGWRPQLEELAMHFRATLPVKLLEAARQVREMSPMQKRAVQNLVFLPVAEGQLLAAVAHLLQHGCPAVVRVADPQRYGLGPAIEAVNLCLEHLRQLHGLQASVRLEYVPDHTTGADLLYFGTPAAEVWDSIREQGPAVIAPRPVTAGYAEPLRAAPPRPVLLAQGSPGEPVQATLKYLLQNVFRKSEFREGQLEIIIRTLTLRPVVGLLPTAAGKSLCFQLASFCQPGCTLVVDPLRSVILDQRMNLEALGIHRCLAIMSGLDDNVWGQVAREEGYRSIEQGQHLFVFVAPERLQIPGFRRHLRSFAAAIPIPFCVVDEAHCVSEWGHDFRPSYLNIGRLVRDYCKYAGRSPVLVALTGTASRNVLIDILRELGIEDQEAIIEPKSFDRKELIFEVRRVKARDRLPEMIGRLRSILSEFGWQAAQPGDPPSGLIFTNFANASDVGVQHVAKEVRDHLKIPVDIYAGKAPYGATGSRSNWEQQKIETQHRFKTDQSPILVCTQSFGMGFDKPNIRFTIHAMLPRSLEDFYQQAGRAGRDRGQARCLLLFSDDQPGLADELLDTERTPLEEITWKANRVLRHGQGDGIRNTWFLTQNFLGLAVEKRIVHHVVTRILEPRLGSYLGDIHPIEVSFLELPDDLFQFGKKVVVNGETKTMALEKALYRLLLVGAVADYQKDYQRRRFLVDLTASDGQHTYEQLQSYLSRYATEYEAKEFLPKRKTTWADAAFDCVASLIDYIYATIAKRRRRAIGQMLQTARDAARDGGAGDNDRFREQLLAYLEESEFTKPVKVLATRIDPNDWFAVLATVNRPFAQTKAALRKAKGFSPALKSC